MQCNDAVSQVDILACVTHQTPTRKIVLILNPYHFRHLSYPHDPTYARMLLFMLAGSLVHLLILQGSISYEHVVEYDW